MIIPVVDMKDGICVSGRSGKRDTYTKLESIYGDDPIMIAKNLRKNGAKLLYVADLDKIENKSDNSGIISEINKIIPVMLDNGISTINDVKNNTGISTYNIVATETMKSINDTNIILDKYPDKTIISIDIKNNRILLANKNITEKQLIDVINTKSPEYTILLDITHVGTKSEQKNSIKYGIIDKISNTTPVIAGGITNQAIKKYENMGINNFLVGTILHQGELKYKM